MAWVKAFHIIFMVTWFAGLFYLPRLFVYHAMSTDKLSGERFKQMEHKLYYAIMTPSAVLTIGFGLWLWWAYQFAAVWLYIKLGLVAILVAYHLVCGRLLYDFKRDSNRHSARYFRWFNEIPALLLIAIVLLVVLKPF